MDDYAKHVSQLFADVTYRVQGTQRSEKSKHSG